MSTPLRGKLRRIYLTLFRRGYVRRQETRRRGGCRRCGRCCQLVVRCPFLAEGSRCVIYRLTRPTSCVHFPIDARDLADVDSACGFYFVDGDEEPEAGS
jgi:hypothetical protein